MPGRETVRPDLERASPCERSCVETCSSRVPRLRVPTCAVLTLVRRLRGGCPSLSLLRPSPLDSCLRRNDEWLARERRGFGAPPTAWDDRLACYGFVGASITSPHPSPTATTVFVTGFFGSVSPVSIHRNGRRLSVAFGGTSPAGRVLATPATPPAAVLHSIVLATS